MNYIQVDLEVLLEYPRNLPCDVYVHLGRNRYTQLFNAGDAPDRGRFKAYHDRGVEELWIQAGDEINYLEDIRLYVESHLSANTAFDAAFLKTVEELTFHNLNFINANSVVPNEVFMALETSVQCLVQLTQEDVFCAARFLQQTHKRTTFIRHLVSTAIFSVLLARRMRSIDEKMPSELGFAGLIHDLGLSETSYQVSENLHSNLNEQETDEVLKHPLWIRETFVNKSILTESILRTVEEHHESWLGGGYPRGLQGTEIYLPARILAVADHFSALTVGSPERPALSPQLALQSLMQNKSLDPNLVDRFCHLFVAPAA